MSLLSRLPNHLLLYCYSEWLGLKELGLLNVALGKLEVNANLICILADPAFSNTSYKLGTDAYNNVNPARHLEDALDWMARMFGQSSRVALEVILFPYHVYSLKNRRLQQGLTQQYHFVHKINFRILPLCNMECPSDSLFDEMMIWFPRLETLSLTLLFNLLENQEYSLLSVLQSGRIQSFDLLYQTEYVDTAFVQLVGKYLRKLHFFQIDCEELVEVLPSCQSLKWLDIYYFSDELERFEDVLEIVESFSLLESISVLKQSYPQVSHGLGPEWFIDWKTASLKHVDLHVFSCRAATIAMLFEKYSVCLESVQFANFQWEAIRLSGFGALTLKHSHDLQRFISEGEDFTQMISLLSAIASLNVSMSSDIDVDPFCQEICSHEKFIMDLYDLSLNLEDSYALKMVPSFHPLFANLTVFKLNVCDDKVEGLSSYLESICIHLIDTAPNIKTLVIKTGHMLSPSKEICRRMLSELTHLTHVSISQVHNQLAFLNDLRDVSLATGRVFVCVDFPTCDLSRKDIVSALETGWKVVRFVFHDKEIGWRPGGKTFRAYSPPVTAKVFMAAW
ncbi:hypothetical protein EON65_10140 [archaeon]|nr:MAG: hypothetical protein EON65_10140 [archaeon]